MPKDLKHVNGKWQDVNTGEVFPGHVSRDLDVGDRFEDMESKQTFEVAEVFFVGNAKAVRSVSV